MTLKDESQNDFTEQFEVVLAKFNVALAALVAVGTNNAEALQIGVCLVGQTLSKAEQPEVLLETIMGMLRVYLPEKEEKDVFWAGGGVA